MKERILITNPTGKTGYIATRHLLADGYPVRILNRSRNARTRELEQLGAELCTGNLASYTDLTRALQNIKRVYYCYPFLPDLLGSTRQFIRAAQENNIEAVVNMGQWLAEFNDQKSTHTNQIRASYQEYERAGLNVIQFTPGFFADNMSFVTEFAIQFGLMVAPLGTGKNPVPSTSDLGLVVARLLENPAPYIGQRLRPTGPASVSPADMAETLSNVIGRKVRYVDVPDWMALKAFFAGAGEFGLDAFQISQARHYFRESQLGKFDLGGPTNVVKDVTGKEPDDLETIVGGWVSQSPYRERTFRNWWSALKKFMVIPFQPVPSIAQLEQLNQPVL